MNKEIWYGAQDGNVRFGETKSALTDVGINNPQHFTVEGNVQGLHFINQSNQSNTGQGGSATSQTT